MQRHDTTAAWNAVRGLVLVEPNRVQMMPPLSEGSEMPVIPFVASAVVNGQLNSCARPIRVSDGHVPIPHFIYADGSVRRTNEPRARDCPPCYVANSDVTLTAKLNVESVVGWTLLIIGSGRRTVSYVHCAFGARLIQPNMPVHSCEEGDKLVF